MNETTYDRAALALQRALEQANQAALRLARQFSAGVEPDEADVTEYRRRSAGLKFAEAVWRVEAEGMVAAGIAELPPAPHPSVVGRGRPGNESLDLAGDDDPDQAA